jgi:hypothetical protein
LAFRSLPFQSRDASILAFFPTSLAAFQIKVLGNFKSNFSQN